jgi:iron-sulfur cluster assembly protein
MSCCNPYEKDKKKKEPSKQSTTIHRQMTIEEILSMFPDKAERLSQEITNAGLHCVGCHAATWETLEAGMMSHGMDDKAIDTLVKRLNALLLEKVDYSNITLTERAATKYLNILQEDGKQGWGLRFSEVMAGCSGFEYELDYSEKPQQDDAIFEAHGVQVHVKKAMLPRLLGSTIDYVEGLKGSGFKISNPNAKTSCGCGSSHNY